MEVVSTSNLVYSEAKKNKKNNNNNNHVTMAWAATAWCNHGHEFFSYATLFDERSNRKLCINTNMKLFVDLWWQNCGKAPSKKHTQQNQNRSAISWKKKFALLLKCVIFAIIWSEQKKLLFIYCKITNKPGENLVREMGGGRQL